jgi:PTH1 family peptidyl-tRNA hydrolase
MKYLIVGLGNPGKQYDKTRHNIGFAALDSIAAKHGLVFKKQVKFQGELAEGNACLLLKPLTFMNLSGEAVSSVMKYYNLDLGHLLIVVDDVAIPMGQTRLRVDSGTGGHNGLKSIEQSLMTTQYARLRLGVGDREEGVDLSDHVLSRFTEEQQKLVPALLERAVETVELFINSGLTRAMDFANHRLQA